MTTKKKCLPMHRCCRNHQLIDLPIASCASSKQDKNISIQDKNINVSQIDFLIASRARRDRTKTCRIDERSSKDWKVDCQMFVSIDRII